jgi:WhiB family redox-sensing transcriptional regulator
MGVIGESVWNSDRLGPEWMDLLVRPAWHAQAACRGRGPELFFPPSGEDGVLAKAICARCPVREPCLEAGARELGVWGGTSERERRRRRRSRLIGLRESRPA